MTNVQNRTTGASLRSADTHMQPDMLITGQNDDVVIRLMEYLKQEDPSRSDPLLVLKGLDENLRRYYGSNDIRARIAFALLSKYYGKTLDHNMSQIVKQLAAWADVCYLEALGGLLLSTGRTRTDVRGMFETYLHPRLPRGVWLDILVSSGLASESERDEYNLLTEIKKRSGINSLKHVKKDQALLLLLKKYDETNGVDWLISFSIKWDIGHILIFYLIQKWKDPESVRTVAFSHWDRFTALCMLRYNRLLTDEEDDEYMLVYYTRKKDVSPLKLNELQSKFKKKYGKEWIDGVLSRYAHAPVDIKYASILSSAPALTIQPQIVSKLSRESAQVAEDHEELIKKMDIVEVAQPPPTPPPPLPAQEAQALAKHIQEQKRLHQLAKEKKIEARLSEKFMLWVAKLTAKQVVLKFIQSGRGELAFKLLKDKYSGEYALRVGLHTFTNAYQVIKMALDNGMNLKHVLRTMVNEAIRSGNLDKVLDDIVLFNDAQILCKLCKDFHLEDQMYKALRRNRVGIAEITSLFLKAGKTDILLKELRKDYGHAYPTKLRKLIRMKLFVASLFQLYGENAFRFMFDVDKDFTVKFIMQNYGYETDTKLKSALRMLMSLTNNNSVEVLKLLLKNRYDAVVFKLLKQRGIVYAYNTLNRLFGMDTAIRIIEKNDALAELVDGLLRDTTPIKRGQIRPENAVSLALHTNADVVLLINKIRDHIAPVKVFSLLKERFGKIGAIGVVESVYGYEEAVKVIGDDYRLLFKMLKAWMPKDRFYDSIVALWGFDASLCYGDYETRTELILRQLVTEHKPEILFRKLCNKGYGAEVFCAAEKMYGKKALHKYIEAVGFRKAVATLQSLGRHGDLYHIYIKRYGKIKATRWALAHIPLEECFNLSKKYGTENTMVREVIHSKSLNGKEYSEYERIDMIMNAYGINEGIMLMVKNHKELKMYDYLVERFSSTDAFIAISNMLGEKSALRIALTAGYASGAVSVLIKKGRDLKDCFELIYSVTRSIRRTCRILLELTTSHDLFSHMRGTEHELKIIRYLSTKSMLGLDETFMELKRVAKEFDEAVDTMFRANKSNPLMADLIRRNEEEFVPSMVRRYGERKAFGYLVNVLGFGPAIESFAHAVYRMDKTEGMHLTEKENSSRTGPDQLVKSENESENERPNAARTTLTKVSLEERKRESSRVLAPA